jgi:hypothetical protein
MPLIYFGCADAKHATASPRYYHTIFRRHNSDIIWCRFHVAHRTRLYAALWPLRMPGILWAIKLVSSAALRCWLIISAYIFHTFYWLSAYFLAWLAYTILHFSQLLILLYFWFSLHCAWFDIIRLFLTMHAGFAAGWHTFATASRHLPGMPHRRQYLLFPYAIVTHYSSLRSSDYALQIL